MFLLKSNDVKKQNFKRQSRAVSTAGALKNKNTNLTSDREKTSSVFICCADYAVTSGQRS